MEVSSSFLKGRELSVYLFSISTVPDDSELKRRLDRFDPFNVLTNLPDRSGMRGKRDEKGEETKEQAFHPFFLLEIISKIFHNGFCSKDYILHTPY